MSDHTRLTPIPGTVRIVAQPGTRRFRDLLKRERQDVAMLGRHLSEIYDSITFGRVSKPNTLPSVVIELYEERLNEAVAEAERTIDVERLAGVLTLRHCQTAGMCSESHMDEAAAIAASYEGRDR